MKINLEKKDLKKLNQLIKSKDDNIEVADLYITYLNEFYDALNQESLSLFEEHQFYSAWMDAMGVEEDDVELLRLRDIYKLRDIKRLDADKYKQNPYYKNIHIIDKKIGNWHLTYNYFNPYEGFIYCNMSEDGEYKREITHLGYFEEKVPYINLMENDVVWMSITPHEIETMEKAIENSHGNICVFGLGLGYFPYMCSLKDNVKKITIVEIDQNAIDLFNNEILPEFEHKEKIEIIKMDAFKYMQTLFKYQKFDYAFVDLWHDENDGVSMYIKMKQLESKFANAQFDYWIEPSLIASIRRSVIILFQEALIGFDDKNYFKAKNENDKLINALYWELKNYEINSFEDILSLLEKESIIKLIINLKIK